jgi:hypothetical protein
MHRLAVETLRQHDQEEAKPMTMVAMALISGVTPKRIMA